MVTWHVMSGVGVFPLVVTSGCSEAARFGAFSRDGFSDCSCACENKVKGSWGAEGTGPVTGQGSPAASVSDAALFFFFFFFFFLLT
ncbi:rCG27512 [Rattus norvegicus]|uniref:RCG27512 n=1 Tax=Rattus norvegicus TaxID=10116 RepID=A6K7A6_RAT|nr:rCG27512 [Rattus norvegicus]